MAKHKIRPEHNTNGFQKNPQNINRTGANRKSYAIYIKILKDKGYEAPSKNEYFEMVGLFLVMTEADLKEFAENKTNPYWLRILVADLNDKKIRSKIQSDYRDWLFGKAEQKTETTVNLSDKLEQIKKISFINNTVNEDDI